MKRFISKLFVLVLSFLFVLPLFASSDLVKADESENIVLLQIVVERGTVLTETALDDFINKDIEKGNSDPSYTSKFNSMSSDNRTNYKKNNAGKYTTRVWNGDGSTFIPDSEDTRGYIKFDTVTIVSQSYFSNSDFKTTVFPTRSKLETFIQNPDMFCERSGDNFVISAMDPFCGPENRDNKVDSFFGLANNREYFNKNIAYLKLTDKGNVTISVANGVTLSGLQLFYIVPIVTEAGTQLLCPGNADNICTRAKSLSDVSSNWKDTARVGTLNFSGSSINNVFEKSSSSRGGEIYSGFNIFDEMSSTYSSLAKTLVDDGDPYPPGIYVTSVFTVSYIPSGKSESVTYNVNGRIREFEFTSIGNTGDSAASSHSVSYVIGTTTVNTVSNIAALITQTETKENSKMRSEFMEIFNKYVKPIAYAVIGIMFVVTGTMTVITIVKSSDEPEVRSAGIKRLIVLVTGAVVVFLVIALFEPIVTAVSGWF